MKFAVIKLGGNLIENGTSTTGGVKEAFSIIRMLADAGHSVDVYCRPLARQAAPTKSYSLFGAKPKSKYESFDIENDYSKAVDGSYDALLVFNGNVTYFGGLDKPEWTIAYKVINNFKGRVFYINTDLRLYLRQIWPSVKIKSWADKWSEEDLMVKRDDIVYICQANKPEVVISEVNRCSDTVKIRDYARFDFHKFPLYDQGRLYSSLKFNNDPKFDLAYGGTFRSGRREIDMVKFFFGYPDDISVEMFGKLSIGDFNPKKVNGAKPPYFGPEVNSDDFIARVNRDAMSSVMISDPAYKKAEMFTLRIYENILARSVTFIDSTFDPDKKIFTDPELREFCYVKSRDDVTKRIRRLKDEEGFRKHIVDLQLSTLGFNRDDYRDELVDTIKKFM